MNHINDVIKAAADTFEGLKSGKINHSVGKEMNNSCGKIISANNMQLKYYELRKEKPNIPFLVAKAPK